MTKQLVPGKVLVSAAELRRITRGLGIKVSHRCADVDTLLVVGVLKGAFMFTADLVRALTRPVEVDFITCSSYSAGAVSSGHVDILQDTRIDVAGRTILLVEDIVDSGRTMAKLREHFLNRNARRVEVCAMLTRGVRTDVLGGIALRDNTFVVGYGLDYQERYRELPALHAGVWVDEEA